MHEGGICYFFFFFKGKATSATKKSLLQRMLFCTGIQMEITLFCCLLNSQLEEFPSLFLAQANELWIIFF